MDTAPVIVGVAHQTLPVGDLELAEQFYVGTLGLTLVRRIDAEAFATYVPERIAELDGGDDTPLHLELRCGALELHLFLQTGYRRATLRPHPHLAFEVGADDLERFEARLRARGVPFDGPRRLGPPGHASIYFPDPFGNLLELSTSSYTPPRGVGDIPIGPPDLRSLE